MKFFLLTLGCQMNISDGERIRTVLKNMGFEETTEEEDAILVGVLACSVRQKAIDKVHYLIHKWEQRKKEKPLITFISGCILPHDREKFLKRFDLLFSINELPNLPTMLKQYGISTPYSMNSMPNIEHAIEQDEITSTADKRSQEPKGERTDIDFWKIKPSYSSKYEAFVSIQNGCDKFCTFCAVPYTRGREISRASSDILQEIYGLMKQGYKSITLLGQNVNSYGLDMKGKELNFAQLLARIGNMAEELEHDCWIYFTSPHPRDMTREVLEVMARYSNIAKQVHLPLQSGDDKLLMKMNRAHSMIRYDKVVQDIRELLPEATLFTDIIVGFCGESDAQFQNTVEAMKKYKYSMAYIAMYSPRPGAASSRWKDDVPLDKKKERYRILSDVLIQTTQEHNKRLVDSTQKLLVDKIKPLKDMSEQYAPIMLSAKTEGRIPVQVKIPQALWNGVNQKDFESYIVGSFIKGKVVDIHALSLICELAEIPPKQALSDKDIAV